MLDSLEIISRQQLLDFPATDTMVVTVNNRMAIHLKKELIAAKRHDAKVFQLAQVQPWNLFLEFLYERLIFTAGKVPAAKQLTPFASLLYWEAVLEEQHLNTLNLTKLAKVLSDAYTLQVEWGVQVEALEETPEYIEYKKIKAHYLQRLQERDAIDGPLKNQWLLEQLQQHAVNASSNTDSSTDTTQRLQKNIAKKIVLLGFRELSAIQVDLLNTCQALGAELYILESELEEVAKLQVIRTQSRAEELEVAVNWAKQMLQKHPRGRFAIIDPMLQTELNTVRRYLHERIQDGGLNADLLYNVAIGRPLSDWSIVRSALAWLKLFIKLSASKRMPTQEIGESLLLAQEALVSTWADQLSAVDLALRQNNKVSYSKHQVKQFLYDISDEFSELTERAFALFADDEKYLRLNRWLQKFKAFFELFAFPGIKKLSSAQYQVCGAFEQALKNAVPLSQALDHMTASDAYYLFERVCKQQIFQPQRAPTARLDVLGMLEAEGAKWDAVWILSMQGDVLPTVPKPNPLLPKSALLRVDAPRTDHKREFLWAEAMLKSLLKTAPDITISWHAFAGEMPTKASPLIHQHLAEEKWAKVEDLDEVNQAATESQQATPAALEFLRDDYGPPVPADGLLSGGSRLIDLQAINPQWAFAVYRLHMRAFEPYPRYELDRMQRGSFIHASLESFWRDVRDQATLNAMSDSELEAKIAEVVDASARSELLFDSATLLALEKDFAKSQLFHFLKLEQQRELAFTVADIEKNAEITLSKIKIRVKIDRVDFLENDSYLYLDYKTGNLPNYKQNWYRERPIDLQLPLYAAYGEHPINEVGGVGFGGLKPKQMGFAGIGLANWSYPGRSGVELKEEAEFEQQLSHWKGVLMGLADEIARGYAVNRYVSQKDMQYCEVLPFLRLDQVFDEEENDND